MSLPDRPVLLVTDRRQTRRPLEEVIAAALKAGCRWVSLREKDLPPAEQRALAGRLLPIIRRSSARLTMHGDAALAKGCGADGVHLSSGGDPRNARAIFGSGGLVGISIHTAAEAAVADPATLDYVIAGPAFLTASKPGYGPALGCAGLAAIVEASVVPVIAIGGIDAANVAAVKAAGAAGVAVMGGIMRASDPSREMERLLAAHAR